jgi:hypothetical protein
MFENYDLAGGGLMGFGLLFLLCAAWLAAKARGLARNEGERPASFAGRNVEE